MGAGAAANHHRHAVTAGDSLISLVQSDMDALGQDTTTFRYFLAFEFEVFDSNGRFLAFVNRDQKDPNIPSPRPLSYNERQLEKGVALPFFIWPNSIRSARSTSSRQFWNSAAAMTSPTTRSPKLSRARRFVQQARAAKRAVFEEADPFRFDASEVRFLARRKAPYRAVIDLSRNDDVILDAQHYFQIPNAEDRLYIPPHFVSMFIDRGWRLEV